MGMSTIPETDVGAVIKSLSTLEDDLDATSAKAADMRKSLASSARSEIEKLMEEVQKMATEEAESIIKDAREKAKARAEEIARKGDKDIMDIKSRIDAAFDDAVSHVVNAVLKS